MTFPEASGHLLTTCGWYGSPMRCWVWVPVHGFGRHGTLPKNPSTCADHWSYFVTQNKHSVHSPTSLSTPRDLRHLETLSEDPGPAPIWGPGSHKKDVVPCTELLHSDKHIALLRWWHHLYAACPMAMAIHATHVLIGVSLINSNCQSTGT